ncbi:MAG: FKBP-type peptidyl-prolyl cis-trans isomerase [Nitrospiraceae bacterium]
MTHVQSRLVAAIAMVAVLTGAGLPLPAWAETQPPVADGMKVTLEYTLALPDKTVIESNVGREPITYVHGSHQIIRGLEKGLTGMKTGDKKHITVAPEEAYGVYDEKKKVAVPKDKIPSEAKVGTRLRSPDGQEAKVVAIEGGSAVIDTNHPLAGKALVFDINILKVEKQENETKPNK